MVEKVKLFSPSVTEVCSIRHQKHLARKVMMSQVVQEPNSPHGQFWLVYLQNGQLSKLIKTVDSSCMCVGKNRPTVGNCRGHILWYRTPSPNSSMMG